MRPEVVFRFVPGRGKPDPFAARGEADWGGSCTGGGAAATGTPGAGLDFCILLIRSSNIDKSLSGILPIILYVCFSPA